MSILVADFGLVRIVHPGVTIPDTCGTLSYMASETLDRLGHSFAVDIWYTGVIVYFMLCGDIPFDCETDDKTKTAILTGDHAYDPPGCMYRQTQNTSYTVVSLQTPRNESQ